MKRLNNIKPLDISAVKAAESHWNDVAKPLGSLGLLEAYVVQIAGITGSADINLSKRYAVIMCADNGVVCEGVSQTGSEVTTIVANAIADGTSNISRMANQFNADVLAVDIGINSDKVSEKVLNKRIADGTNNIAKGAAMSFQQAQAAISVGMDIVEELKSKDVNIIVTGEMGIGNTTTSSALSAVLLNEKAEAVTGRGAGLNDEALMRKIEVIKKAIKINSPYNNDAVELLAKLGGYDIAGMVGLFLGGAVYNVPIVIDGLISTVAAVIAAKICPTAADYMLCSHASQEPAAVKLLNMIGKTPVIRAGLRLGEGTGGILLLPMLDGALSVYNSAHRFDDLPMERYVQY